MKTIAQHINKISRRLLCATAVLFIGSFNSSDAQLIVAEDFLYAQPTKAFGAGGGFTRQGYGGGQHTELGQWTDIWNSFGDGVITGADIAGEAFAETFNPEFDMFAGVTRNGLSDNWLDRDYSLTGLDEEQTIYFGVTMRSNDEFAIPNSTFFLSGAGGASQIGMGYTEAGFRALLGDFLEGDGDVGIVPGPEITDGLDPHRLIGKLEINASGADERLTVWLDPTGVETAVESIEAQADVVSGVSDLTGNLRLDHVGSGGLMFWDDLAVGTTWESVASVSIPRVNLLADTGDNELRWSNETETDLEVTFLQAESEGGFRDRRWESLADQGVSGFQENNPTRNRLTESNLFESLSLNSGDSVTWGNALGGREDIIAHVGTSDGLLNVANVVYGDIPDPEVAGADVDGDGVIGLADIDSLCSQISAGTNGSAFDLTGDGVVDGEDLASFLEQTGTLAADTNFDGRVDFPDFLALSSNFGQSERTWSQGDVDCNGAVQFADFLILSSNFGQSAGAAASVPEPQGMVQMLVLAGMILVVRRKR